MFARSLEVADANLKRLARIFDPPAPTIEVSEFTPEEWADLPGLERLFNQRERVRLRAENAVLRREASVLLEIAFNQNQFIRRWIRGERDDDFD